MTWGDVGRQQITELVHNHYNPYRRQTNLQTLFSELGNSNLADPSPLERHYIVTDRDMYAEDTNFVFGVTRSHGGIAIQSLARFMADIRSPADQATMARHIARHEYAHMIGMNTPSDYANPDMRGGLHEGHCANNCTLHQVMNVPESIQLVSGLDFFTDAGFCGSCVKRIRTKI